MFWWKDLYIAFAGQMAQPQGFTTLAIQDVGQIVSVGRHGPDPRIVSATDPGDLDALKRLAMGGEEQAIYAECSRSHQ